MGTISSPQPPSSLAAASAIRARYLSRLKDPRSLLRLFKGEVDLRKLLRGLSALGGSRRPAASDSLAGRLDAALGALRGPATILLATGDRTAQAFMDNCPAALARSAVERLDSASHSFAGDDGDWLAARILEILA